MQSFQIGGVRGPLVASFAALITRLARRDAFARVTKVVTIRLVFAGKPIIGIAGGIGSGKSYVARLFGELGCLVISSDEQVAEVYRDPVVRDVLKKWWGEGVVKADGEIDKRFIASKVFADPAERRKLEELLHPLVATARRRAMEQAKGDTVAFVWDTPLLFETGLNKECDVVVFVDAPLPVRLKRVLESRRWDEAELARRENSQWALDKKAAISDYVISNTADAGFARKQVQELLPRILAKTPS